MQPEIPEFQEAGQGLVADFDEDGVHHDEQADGDGDGDADELAFLEGGGGVGLEVAEDDAEGHGEEDPYGEEAVEETELFEGGKGGLGFCKTCGNKVRVGRCEGLENRRDKQPVAHPEWGGSDLSGIVVEVGVADIVLGCCESGVKWIGTRPSRPQCIRLEQDEVENLMMMMMMKRKRYCEFDELMYPAAPKDPEFVLKFCSDANVTDSL